MCDAADHGVSEAASRLNAAHAGHTVAVKVTDAKGETTLLLDSLAPLIANELAARGFTIVEDAATADFVALATFSIDEGREVYSTYQVPQYGITGYSSSNAYGYVNRNTGTVSAYSYNRPQYGVTGTSTQVTRDTVYRRVMTLGISERSDGGRKVVFEGRLRSNGGCGSLTKVAPYLVKGMSRSFRPVVLAKWSCRRPNWTAKRRGASHVRLGRALGAATGQPLCRNIVTRRWMRRVSSTSLTPAPTMPAMRISSATVRVRMKAVVIWAPRPLTRSCLSKAFMWPRLLRATVVTQWSRDVTGPSAVRVIGDTAADVDEGEAQARAGRGPGARTGGGFVGQPGDAIEDLAHGAGGVHVERQGERLVGRHLPVFGERLHAVVDQPAGLVEQAAAARVAARPVLGARDLPQVPVGHVAAVDVEKRAAGKPHADRISVTELEQAEPGQESPHVAKLHRAFQGHEPVAAPALPGLCEAKRAGTLEVLRGIFQPHHARSLRLMLFPRARHNVGTSGGVARGEMRRPARGTKTATLRSGAMTTPADAARKYREEASTWRRVAEAIPDIRRRMYWQRLADDYAALAAKVEAVAAKPRAAEPAE
jgi:hypothetical protein